MHPQFSSPEAEVAALRAENARLKRLLDLTAEQARQPAATQTGQFLDRPGPVTASSSGPVGLDRSRDVPARRPRLAADGTAPLVVLTARSDDGDRLFRRRGSLTCALISAGRWDEAGKVVEESLSLMPPPHGRTRLLLCRGWLAVHCGQPAVASAVLEELAPARKGNRPSSSSR